MPLDQTHPYHYFVTFAAGISVGNTEIFRATPMRSLRDVAEVQDGLRRSVPGAVVTGWQRFERS